MCSFGPGKIASQLRVHTVLAVALFGSDTHMGVGVANNLQFHSDLEPLAP